MGSDPRLYNESLFVALSAQLFMTEFNGAVSEEEKIVAITKIFLNVTKQSDY
jgi:hypothetical protein